MAKWVLPVQPDLNGAVEIAIPTDSTEISDARSIQMMRVQDPRYFINGHPVPALTTLLFKICDRDHNKFDEACRLIDLFMKEAEK